LWWQQRARVDRRDRPPLPHDLLSSYELLNAIS
jgi:hypothetical protein